MLFLTITTRVISSGEVGGGLLPIEKQGKAALFCYKTDLNSDLL